MTRSIYTWIATVSLAVAVYAAGDEDVFEWQPEIHHAFRPDERMPAEWFSQLFALATLAPWLILVIGWFSLGLTPVKAVSELTAGSANRSISVIAFLGSLIAVEYLFYQYWTTLNLFQTLGYLAPLSILVFATGQRALTQVQIRRKTQK
ncbi:hypothetical protein DFQ28_003587 [Apophysomyces sp. BC1034]|nr:hypothetical protein DFQ30_003530 [Apophysomyces sp. BC1015]KAG0179026.1 hypothetical protein DFQ29_002706 [Apophysomyces sp. BC1021]KAG0189295.1 hypothetical protein DFQ28_003587 [Apophysomyces sp. BC1034]